MVGLQHWHSSNIERCTEQKTKKLLTRNLLISWILWEKKKRWEIQHISWFNYASITKLSQGMTSSTEVTKQQQWQLILKPSFSNHIIFLDLHLIEQKPKQKGFGKFTHCGSFASVGGNVFYFFFFTMYFKYIFTFLTFYICPSLVYEFLKSTSGKGAINSMRLNFYKSKSIKVSTTKKRLKQG